MKAEDGMVTLFDRATGSRSRRDFLRSSSPHNGSSPAAPPSEVVVRRLSMSAFPTLVLNCGGSGGRTGGHLRDLLPPGHKSFIEMIDLDTDLGEVAGRLDGRESSEVVPLPVWRPSNILNRRKFYPSLSWLPEELAQSPIWLGGEQKPLNGAFAFWVNYAEVAERIKGALSRLLKLRAPGQRDSDPSHVRVAIVSSSSGATGRGCLIPLGLCIRDIIDEKQGTADCNVSVEAFILLPSVFQDVLDSQKQAVAYANTYALLKEISYLDEHPSAWPYRFRERQPVRHLQQPPFDRVVFVDSRTQSGEVIQTADIYRFLAELLAIRFEPRCIESMTTDSIAVNAPTKRIFGRLARYQGVGGFCLKFDAAAAIDYSVPRFFREEVAGRLLLHKPISRDAFSPGDFIPTQEAVEAGIGGLVSEDDLLSPSRFLRDRDYGPEFLRVNLPADLAWEADRVAKEFGEKRAGFQQILARATAAARETALADVRKAFHEACVSAGGGLPACREQFGRVVDGLIEKVNRLYVPDVRPAESEHETALAQLAEAASARLFPGCRARRAFRRWLASFRRFAETVRSAEIQGAVRLVFTGVVEECRGRLAALDRLIRYLVRMAAGGGGDRVVSSRESPSPIVSSAIPAARYPDIYSAILSGSVDPSALLAETVGSFDELLVGDDDAGYAVLFDPLVDRLAVRFAVDLGRHDIYGLCARFGGADIGRFLGDALSAKPFISLDRGYLGENSPGEVVVVTAPACPETEKLREKYQDSRVQVQDSINPHRIVVTCAYTNYPLFALANLPLYKDAYDKAMVEARTNIERYPHIHKDFLKPDFSFEITPDPDEIKKGGELEGLRCC